MVTLAQRIEALRTEAGMSRPALSAALGLPKNAVEKFESGRQTPTQAQQAQLAAYFGVSLFYLRGESNDKTRQDSWMDAPFDGGEPAAPPRSVPKAAPAATPRGGGQEPGAVFDAFWNNKAFQDMVRAALLDVLRSPEGQELLQRSIRKELDRR